MGEGERAWEEKCKGNVGMKRGWIRDTQLRCLKGREVFTFEHRRGEKRNQRDKETIRRDGIWVMMMEYAPARQRRPFMRSLE